jgi:hypothetical protein
MPERAKNKEILAEPLLTGGNMRKLSVLPILSFSNRSNFVLNLKRNYVMPQIFTTYFFIKKFQWVCFV